LQKNRFIGPVKGKIIIASVLVCAALFTAWDTSRNAFTVVLNSFENISAPNEKLRQVNDLNYLIMRLGQEQGITLLNRHKTNPGFFAETQKITVKIDTLTTLYANAPRQIKRLTTLKHLLQDRDKFYTDYLDVREGLINNRAFSDQIARLTDMVNNSANQTDSLVTSTENKTSTTVTPAEIKQHLGFFKKLFGKKNTDTAKNYKVVEEVNIKHDTLTSGLKDSLIKGVGQTMQKMAKTQQAKSRMFVKRESLLIKANANVTRQMLAILQKVETDAVSQATLDDAGAKNAVRKGIERIGIIMLSFALLTALMLYFILRDISRIDKYRRELEVAKEEAVSFGLAKHRFLSNMSHELRTPLQSILGFAELIKNDPNPQKRDIETIYRSANHLLQIVNEVLDYNRIVSGKFAFVNEAFNLQQLLNEVLSVMRPQVEKKGLKLISEFNIKSAGGLKGDAFRLKQVLYNLLGNAIKFTDAGEIILKMEVRSLKNSTACSFEVIDTGVGLSENEIGRIFNEFEQAGNEKRVQSGTGLGLAITRALIEGQGGHISVQSEPGKGSSFAFVLKYKKAAETVTINPKTPVQLPVEKAGKVWLIDDDTFILEFCARVFDMHKIAYRCFSSPSEMLAAGWDDEVKFILIDMRMPEMNGTDLCRLMRKKVPANTLIYALTAQVMQDEVGQITESGFNGLLMKPFSGKELLNIVTSGNATNAGETSPLLNMDTLEKMAFGNPEQIGQILLHFADDTANDLSRLNTVITQKNINEILLLTHRIAGRTAQIGAGDLSKNFRLAELALRKSRDLPAEWITNINNLSAELNSLVLSVREIAANEVAG